MIQEMGVAIELNSVGATDVKEDDPLKSRGNHPSRTSVAKMAA